MRAWSKEGGMTYTPQCLAWRLEWGPLRYSGEREEGGESGDLGREREVGGGGI